jgi:hypothetical protein
MGSFKINGIVFIGIVHYIGIFKVIKAFWLDFTFRLTFYQKFIMIYSWDQTLNQLPVGGVELKPASDIL